MPIYRSTSWIVVFLAGALGIAGCAADTTSTESGSLNVNLQLEGGVVINAVDWVVTGNGIDPLSGTVNTSAPGSTASVEVFGIPPGDDYLVELEATSEDGEVTCHGSAEFNVEVGVATDVMVMLNCKLPPRFGGVRVNGKFNICAELTRVVVSPLQTSVGNDIDLASMAVDADGDPISYLWSGDGDSIADPSAASTTYTCQEVGDHEIMVSVSDDDVHCDMATWTVPITCVTGEDLCRDVTCEDDGNECTATACNPANGMCETSNVDNGPDCDGGAGMCIDGECMPNDLCNGVDCDDGNECTSDVCDPADGSCGNTPVDDGTACDDGLGMCMGGQCVANPECVVDEDCVETNQCKMGVCDAGTCQSVNLEDGASCTLPDIGDAQCTMGECVPINVTLGNDFILAFEANFSTPALSLFLSGPVATSGEVSIGDGFAESFTVTPGEVTTVTLPTGSEITTSDVIEANAAVRVVAEAPITVYGLNQLQFTTDAFAGLPGPSLGQRYRVMAWQGGQSGPSQFAIAAIPGLGGDLSTPTSVTITPSADSGARLAGVPYTIQMNPLDAYQLQSEGDLTGTLIEASRPVAVFGGNRCANVPNQNTGFCDHIVEQIPPTSTWGNEALTVPLATRMAGDSFRIMADQVDTTVQLEGATPETFTLGAGEFADRVLVGSYRISSDAPILVAQYSNGSEWDGVTSDPFMMLLPSSQQFLDSYTFATPGTGFPANYANIVALSSDVTAGSVLLDGVAIPAGDFTVLAGTAFSVTQAPITVDTHTLSAPNPLGLYVYGFASFDSYGYPGGFSAGTP